jgi:dihydrofolate synthase/folylpolyglutamate synthase
LSYNDAVRFIDASKKLGSRPGLERISRLCALAGDPQDAVPAVHVAGTNGKGSTSAMLASVLSASGYGTGLYTSPYIEDVCECIRIDGRQMSHEELAELAEEIRRMAERMAGEGDAPTEFEIETAIAFLWFMRSGCDAMVVEAGLGGRLDATNVLKRPLVSVITSISLDHTSILGGTIREITNEKCGILKSGGVAVSYPMQPEEALGVLRERSEATGNELILPDVAKWDVLRAGLDGTDIVYKGLPVHIPFVGRHQVFNSITVVEAAHALRERRGLAISDDNIREGINKAFIACRQEVVGKNPIILLDGAHNPDGLAALADTMRSQLSGKRTAVVMGMLADKDYGRSVALIAPLCGKLIASKPASPRALASGKLAACAGKHCADVSVEDDYAKALDKAMAYAGKDGAVVVCGSLYLAVPVRKLLMK